MVDFLKQNPYVTREQYMWEWTIPQIRLASYDYTHVNYLSDGEKGNNKSKKYDDPDVLMNDLGIPVF